MSEFELRKFLNFDESDLIANRRGQATEKQKAALAEKQKELKRYNACLGVIVVGVLGIVVVSTLMKPMLSVVKNLTTGGGLSMDTIAILCVVGLMLTIIIGVSIASFNRINRKAEHEIRRAEGTVNFVWVERKERTSTGSGHKTVRSLEMRVGTDAKFTGMSDQLPNLINQGDEWIFYYTNYPFMFLSAEQVK